MSISMEKFASEGHFATYDPYLSNFPRVQVSSIQCISCGFEPVDTVIPPRICPKCHGQAWERLIKPGSILENAERYGERLQLTNDINE